MGSEFNVTGTDICVVTPLSKSDCGRIIWSVVEALNLEMGSPSSCSMCGILLEVESAELHFRERILCRDCYDNETSLCEYCNTRVWNNEISSDGQISICKECGTKFFTKCYDCGQYVHKDIAERINGEYYCQYCYHDSGYPMISTGTVTIHSHLYKPATIFYGEGRLYGVELEVDKGGKSESNAMQILQLANVENELLYIKQDSSIKDGFELISHPMSYSFHRDNMPWDEILTKVGQLGYLSDGAEMCGYHVHAERSAFGDNMAEQDENIAKILFFVEEHWQKFLIFSRRTEAQMERWCRNYGQRDTATSLLHHAKNVDWSKYRCINLLSMDTVEFRFFKGTLSYNVFISAIQLIDELCEMVLTLTLDEVLDLSWEGFVGRINCSDKVELKNYLLSRGLQCGSGLWAQE